MDIVKTIGFGEFEPWSGAVDTWETLQKHNMIDAFEQLIEDTYGDVDDTIDETKLNDILWFESDWIYDNLDMPHGDSVIVDEAEVIAYCEQTIGPDLVMAEDGEDPDWAAITEQINDFAENNEIYEWYFAGGGEQENSGKDLLDEWYNQTGYEVFCERKYYDYDEDDE